MHMTSDRISGACACTLVCPPTRALFFASPYNIHICIVSLHAALCSATGTWYEGVSKTANHAQML